MSSCQSYSIRTEVGLGEPLVFPKATNIGSGKNISVIHKAIYFGFPLVDLSKRLKLDIFTGPSAEIITDDNDTFGFGLDILPRLRYTYWRGVEPYFSLNLGFHYFDNKIGEQGTHWGFVLGGGPGIRLKIKENLWIYTEYRAWHESNGASIFGSPNPNPGFNTDLCIIGIEYGF